MSRTIWWIRRDLRLHDNQALDAAVRAGQEVIPLWVFDPTLVNSPNVGQRRLAFLRAGLRTLAADLESRGSRLIVRNGVPGEVVPAVVSESGASAVFAEADYTPYARRRDRAVAERVPLELHDGVSVQPPGAVLKPDGEPYVMFSAFKRTWLALPRPAKEALLAAPEQLDTPTLASSQTSSDESEVAQDLVDFPAGEAEARRRLDAFVATDLAKYDVRRDALDAVRTSLLSPYLRFGMLSPRLAAVAALEARSRAGDGAEAWLDELIWRDFFLHVLYHFPSVENESFRTQYRSLRWHEDKAQLAAWKEGRTGYPIVDAAMRQLADTGWIPNRVRMIAASFLSKHLLLAWRDGEQWFRRQLLDGDLAANNGNWQWVAGTGTDAAPYFRIFNPVAQGKKYDPDGTYVRSWVPELAEVPSKYVHEPWCMPVALQEKLACIIGDDYPEPLVEHTAARERALAFYRGEDVNSGGN